MIGAREAYSSRRGAETHSQESPSQSGFTHSLSPGSAGLGETGLDHDSAFHRTKDTMASVSAANTAGGSQASSTSAGSGAVEANDKTGCGSVNPQDNTSASLWETKGLVVC